MTPKNKNNQKVSKLKAFKMKVNTKTLLRPQHNPKNSPIGPQKSPSHLKKQKKSQNKKCQIYLYMKLDLFHLSSLQLQSTSTSYNCDIKATQSCF